jgi:ribose transport system ATP-binding protein
MVGRSVCALSPQRPPVAPGPVALEATALASPPGLREASFSLRKGEVLGVFGLMGSGRSELVRALFGLDPRATGELSVFGRRCRSGESPSVRLRRGLGYLSEDRKGEGLALALPVADNVTLTRLSSCSRHGVLQPAVQALQARTACEELGVRMTGVSQPARALSGGNQQKLALARLVHQDAAVLLLDEPTRGVDVASRAQIYAAIARAAAHGKAVLMVSSYLPELLGACDRVAVMSRGRLSPASPVAEWSAEGALEAAIGA